MGGVAEMTSAWQEGYNSICALTVCHYTLYLHETQKPRGGRSQRKATGGEDALVHVEAYN